MDNPNPQPTPANYSERTTRMKVLLAAVWTLIVIVVWVGLVWPNIHPSEVVARQRRAGEIPVRAVINREVIAADILAAVDAAKAKAMTHAAGDLTAWTAELAASAEDDFVPWYFGYFTQQALALEGLYNQVRNLFVKDGPSAADAVRKRIDREFAARVLSPEMADRRYERVVRDAVSLFVEDVRVRVAAIPVKYNIPASEWQSYIADAGGILGNVEGNRSVRLSVKAATVPVAAGTVVAGKVCAEFCKNVVSRMSAKLAGTTAEVLAPEAGAAAGESAAVCGEGLAGPVIGLAIAGWDVADHYYTAHENAPVMIENIKKLLAELRETLLNDPVTGVKGVLNTLEDKILSSLPAEKH